MLAAGNKLGPYEIVALLGAGGMGEVYRALDPRIGREVAIKVLPAAFSEEADRLRRFEQEARAAGALNHANVLAVFDIGNHQGSPYLVTELLDGETLRDRLNQGGIPRRKAIDFAIQLVEGLAAAHEKGIIHRDLKPENLFLSRDGRLKILDFGLAKLIQPEVTTAESSKLQTAGLQSLPGTILGTIGYMAPEQVRGKPADHRSDIFTFGTILYEMLTAKKAFHGETQADTLGAILHQDPPDLSGTVPGLQPGLQKIISRCLEKSPEERFQSTRDLGFALEAISGYSESRSTVIAPAETAPIAARRPKTTFVLGGIALLFFITSTIFAFLYFSRKETRDGVIRFQLQQPGGSYVGNYNRTVISPDGKRVAFLSVAQFGQNMISIRSMDSLLSEPLNGTNAAVSVFWSPDSRYLGFFSGGKLKKIAVSGGTPEILCDAAAGRGASWNRDNVIIFAPDQNSPLYRVSGSGGEATKITELDEKNQEISHRFPRFLPDGKHFLYQVRRDQGDSYVSFRERLAAVYIGSLEDSKLKKSLNIPSSAEYAHPGFLFFVRNGNLVANRFDVKSLEMKGEPFSLDQDIAGSDQFGGIDFSVSENGILIFRTQESVNREKLIWYDRGGRQTQTLSDPGEYGDPELSPDGNRLALARADSQTGVQDIWIHDSLRGMMSRFTFSGADDPTWSPDGSEIIYSNGDLYKTSAIGTKKPELLLKSSMDKVPVDWSSDGKYLLYVMHEGSTGSDLWVLPLQKKGSKPFPFLQSPFVEAHGQISPDARWVAYASDESGKYEVYVQSFPSPEQGKWKISSNGGTMPRWRKDGKELFYLSLDRKIMAAPIVSTATGLEPGLPADLFQTNAFAQFERRNRYVVSPDGSRFGVSTQITESPPFVTAIVNWNLLIPQ